MYLYPTSYLRNYYANSCTIDLERVLKTMNREKYAFLLISEVTGLISKNKIMSIEIPE
jgi:hypothetical protein